MGGGVEGGGDCVYEGGKKIELPGIGEGKFIGGGEGERFQIGVPMFFVVRVRVWERRGERAGEGRGMVAEGEWERVFSVVQEEGMEVGLEVEESVWGCEGGGAGYLVSFYYFSFILLA